MRPINNAVVVVVSAALFAPTSIARSQSERDFTRLSSLEGVYSPENIFLSDRFELVGDQIIYKKTGSQNSGLGGGWKEGDPIYSGLKFKDRSPGYGLYEYFNYSATCHNRYVDPKTLGVSALTGPCVVVFTYKRKSSPADLEELSFRSDGGARGGYRSLRAAPGTPAKPTVVAPPAALSTPARPSLSQPSSACDPAALAGRWTNTGREYAGWGVSLTVSGDRSVVSGDFERTLRRAPTDRRPDWPHPMLRAFQLGAPIAGPAGGACRYKATGYVYGSGISTPWSGVVSVDPGARALRVEGLGESAPWTRGEPPAPVQTCSDGDIEGTWHRPDGARLSVRGMNFKDGGAGVWEAHPDPRWRPGAYRYQSIKPAGACRWTATCVAVSIDSAGSGWQERSGACTLTVDPKTGRLNDSGSNTTGSYTYSREPAEGSREAQDLNAEVNRKNAEAEAREKAREAEYERKMREYEARKKADADAYARAQQEYERQKAEVEAKRQRELREWQERVRRCQEGDITACAQP